MSIFREHHRRVLDLSDGIGYPTQRIILAINKMRLLFHVTRAI
jgi:hypothetical protein